MQPSNSPFWRKKHLGGGGIHIFTSLCKEKSHSKQDLSRNSKYVNISAVSALFEEAQDSNLSAIITKSQTKLFIKSEDFKYYKSCFN